MFKSFQSKIIGLYRTVTIIILVTIITGVISYLGLLGVYGTNHSWSTPLTLSPTQQRVLSFQPQVAGIEASLSKQEAELESTNLKIAGSVEQLSKIKALMARSAAASGVEARQLATSSRLINAAATDKRADNKLTANTLLETSILNTRIDEELQARLITSDQAAERKLQLRNIMNAATDANAQALQLEMQSQQLKSASATLSGGASSLTALASIQQSQQLQILATTLEIEIQTNKLTVESLTKAISENKRVIATAKQSPYYTALRQPVNVLFVPYDNFSKLEVGSRVYDCYLQVLICRKVGTVTAIYEAEEYARHPLFKTDLKGKFVGVNFIDNKSAQSNVVFINGKPLLF